MLLDIVASVTPAHTCCRHLETWRCGATAGAGVTVAVGGGIEAVTTEVTEEVTEVVVIPGAVTEAVMVIKAGAPVAGEGLHLRGLRLPRNRF